MIAPALDPLPIDVPDQADYRAPDRVVALVAELLLEIVDQEVEPTAAAAGEVDQ